MKQAPNTIIEPNPRITFNLDPILQNFCKYIFNTPENKKHIKLNRREDIGKLIFSHIQNGDFKLTQPLLPHPITFILPIPNNEHGYWLRCRHIYIPKWVEEKYNDAIEYEFRWWIREKFRIGYDEEGWNQQLIILAILRALNTRNSEANYDRIKKIDYRNRRKAEKKRFKKLCDAEKALLIK